MVGSMTVECAVDHADVQVAPAPSAADRATGDLAGPRTGRSAQGQVDTTNTAAMPSWMNAPQRSVKTANPPATDGSTRSWRSSHRPNSCEAAATPSTRADRFPREPSSKPKGTASVVATTRRVTIDQPPALRCVRNATSSGRLPYQKVS